MQLSPFTTDGADTLRAVLRVTGTPPFVIETTEDAFNRMQVGLYAARSTDADKIALKLRISSTLIPKQWGGVVVRFYISEGDAEAYLRLVASTAATKSVRADLKTRLKYRAEDREAEAIAREADGDEPEVEVAGDDSDREAA